MMKVEDEGASVAQNKKGEDDKWDWWWMRSDDIKFSEAIRKEEEWEGKLLMRESYKDWQSTQINYGGNEKD